MSVQNEAYNLTGSVVGLVRENKQLLERIEGGLEPQQVWIGVQNVLQPYAQQTASAQPHVRYVGPERRGLGPVTVEQLATRLGRKPAEIIFLANRNRIPGAYETDDGWTFDARHTRIWVDDVLKGIVSIPTCGDTVSLVSW